jgi:hypothetical protein
VFFVYKREALLFRGSTRQVGTVEQIQQTHDSVVRQFIDGRPEAAAEADRVIGGASHEAA